MSLRTDGKHTSVAVTMDTRERLRTLAGEMPIYEYLDELTRQLADGGQAQMRRVEGPIPRPESRHTMQRAVERVASGAMFFSGFIAGFLGTREMDEVFDKWCESTRQQLHERMKQGYLPTLGVESK